MPFLGDYLGHLLSEITIARVQADLEAVRVADLYANHPLLKTMPVPRFRLPTMTLDLAVAVKNMEEAKEGEPPRGGVSLPAIRKQFGELLSQHLDRSNIKLSGADRAKLDQDLDRRVSGAGVAAYVSTSTIHVADELVSVVTRALGESKHMKSSEGSARIGKLADELKTAARLAFLTLQAPPPRLQVLVTTAELREAGQREQLAQLHLSISEEAFEWSVRDADGITSSKLMPE